MDEDELNALAMGIFDALAHGDRHLAEKLRRRLCRELDHPASAFKTDDPPVEVPDYSDRPWVTEDEWKAGP